MRIISTILLLTGFAVSLTFCSAARQTKVDKTVNVYSDSTLSYKVLAKKKYSGNIEYIASPANSYMLCQSLEKPSAENPFPSVKFFVYDNIKNSIAYEDNLANGNVAWKNDSTLIINIVPGQVKSDEMPLNNYLYDLKKHKKIFLNMDKK